MRALRAGLVGLGMMGRHHARVLQGLDGVELVGVADAAGDRYGAAGSAQILSGVEDLIALGIDYCVVAVPTVFHEEVGLTLADAGVHALIEKPLTPSRESSERVAAAFEDRNLVGGVGHVERFNPALQAARSRVAAGELGAVYQVATRRQGPFPGRIADVGVIMDLGTHDIDLTAWVTQDQYVTISARTARRSGRDYEDLVAAVGSLGSGAVTNHLVNWLSPMKERTTVITGERGAFVADTLSADLTFYANGQIATTWDDISRFRGVSEGDMTRFAIPKPEPLMVEHERFRDAVVGRGSDIVTMRQGVATVAVAEAMIESARSGLTVETRQLV